MERDFAQRILEAFQANKDSDPDGDYQDFLINYMNGMNHGEPNDVMEDVANALPADRRAAMANGPATGALNLEKNPNIRNARSIINSILGGK